MKFPQQLVDLPDCQENWEFLQAQDGAWRYVGATGQPAFENSWVNGAGSYLASFRKTGTQVRIRGYVTTGTTGTVAWTMPIGMRPPAQLYYPIIADGSPAGTWVNIAPSGGVTVNRAAGAGGYFDITYDTTS